MSGKGGKPRRTAPVTAPGAVSVPANEEPEAAVAPVSAAGARKPPAAAAASPVGGAPSGKQRRTTAQASRSGAVAVAAEEPGAAAGPSIARASSSSSSVGGAPSGKQRRTTAQASRPGAVAVAAEEPGAAAGPSIARASSSSSSVGGAPSGKQRRTTAQASRPGAVAVAMDEPAAMSAPVASPASSGSSLPSKGHRTTARAVAPGAVAVVAEEPSAELTSRAPPAHTDSSNAGSGKGRRTTALALSPGAVSVAAEEPQSPTSIIREMSRRGSKGLTSSLSSGKSRRAVPAMASGAIHVTAATQNAKEIAMETSEMQTNEGTAVQHVTEVEGDSEEAANVRESLTSIESELEQKRKGAVGGGSAVPGAVAMAALDGAEQDAAAAKNGKDAASERSAFMPGAQSVLSSSNETQDSVSNRKDPRARRGGRRNRDAAAKAAAAGAVVGGTTAAVVVHNNNAPPMSSLSDEDYRRRLENKVKEAEQDLMGSNGGKKDVNTAQDDPAYDDSLFKGVPGDDKYSFEDEGNKRPSEDAEPSAGAMRPEGAAVAAPMVATADRGMAVAPDLEYGTTGYGGPGLSGMPDDDALAVAIAITEEDDDLFLPAAVEFDPDAKPPLIKNRRFRLYAISAILLSLVVIVAVILGVVVFKPDAKEPPLPQTYAPTGAPSNAPSSGIEGKYREQWVAVVGPLVNVPGTPHDRAATWMLEEDPPLAVDNENLLQRYLLVLFYIMTTDSGQPWRSCNAPEVQNSDDTTCQYQRYSIEDDEVTYKPEPSFRWLSKEHECLWAGNLCDDIKVTRAIELLGQNITGTLPSELTAFPFLQSIALAYNAFTGTIPTEYASMRHLLSVEVHGNVLTGSIPEEYYEATSLQNLNIGDNFLTGTLSTKIGLLTNLKGFQTFDNIITGTFPSEISKLEFLSFSRNHRNIYSGTVPTVMGELILLQELWMNNNQFTGTLPTELGRMSDMMDLRFHLNKIVGSIPTEIYSLNFLFRLDLFSNHLTGILSTQIGELTGLTELRVSRNDLTGTLPTELALMKGLRLGWFHLNQFDGPIPAGVCALAPNPLIFVQTDCFPEGNEPNSCPCCTACCNRNTEICLVVDDNA